MRTRTILLASLMIMMTLTPLATADFDKEIEQGKEFDESAAFDFPAKSIDSAGPRVDTGTSGRAPCPAVQSDGGTAGDTGNTSTTAKSLGTDPTNGPSGVNGCIDSGDTEDLYSVTTTAGKEVDVELVVPAGADFDLYIVDATKTTFYDYSEFNDPLEKVSTAGTSLEGNATTFYVWVYLYSGDGQYTLRVWTNKSMPKPDMTISMVEGPAKAKAGDSVTVNYTVENLANNSTATTGAFDVFFILSTDTTYDSFDRILDDVSKEADLAAGASRNTSTIVTIPANITNDTYYWIIWADGYNNITESNDTNNNMASPNQTVIGIDCSDLVGSSQNDAGLGSDAAGDTGNATNLGNNVTGTYTGCMDEVDGDDIYAFDVPSGYFIEIMLDAEDNTSDLDLYIHYSNGSQVDRGYSSSYPETATAKLTDYEGTGGTYYVNVTHYSGVSNYTLNVWTNQSIPAPDYAIESITSSASGMRGDSFDVTVVLENGGTIDGVANVDLVTILSVNTGVQWYDHEIGSITTSGIPMKTNTSVTIPSTIPADIVEGGYYLYVIVDQDDLIEERDEDNNQQSRNGQFTVGNAETSCASQNDAGLGGDAGNGTAGALDLGNYADAEYRGCIDSTDTMDHYTISMSAGQNMNITLVDPPEGAVTLSLVDSSGNGVDSDSGYYSDSEVTTLGTTSEGIAGTYTIMINRSNSWLDRGGAGTYRLLIGTPTEYTAPFSCVGYSDAGTGTDAGSDISNPMILGANPTQSGQGCLDGQDTSDSYQFNMQDYNNVHIAFTSDASMLFTANLYDGESNVVAGWNGTEWTSMNDMMYEGMDETFTIVIQSGGAEGYYNISITALPPAEADLAVSNLTCGGDMISNEELFYSFEIHNLRGPAIGDFSWTLDLVDNTGSIVGQIDSATISTYSTYGQLVQERASSTFINSTTATGIYSCHVMVNMDQTINELEIINNDMMSDEFNIQNEEELWSNDQDRDGFNSTDTGDGIVDACPDKYGESTGDRYGCADLDGDGWSNLNDFAPLDESQWVDEDGDGFGDNSSGYEGDQCPGIPGVEDGEGGDGCPPPFVDTDGDGVQDSDDECPNTTEGANVDPENGCEVDTDGDGVVDSKDNCPSTAENVTVDPEDGCEVVNNNGGSGNNGGADSDSEEESEGTSDSSKSGTDIALIGGIGVGVLIIVLLTFMIIRKGRGGDGFRDDAFSNAAFDQTIVTMAAEDPSLTPEQLQYEQQLLAHGYTAEQARAYADSAFGRQTATTNAVDPSITQEQLQYEQQLLAHGYTQEQARAYADQHFRPG